MSEKRPRGCFSLVIALCSTPQASRTGPLGLRVPYASLRTSGLMRWLVRLAVFELNAATDFRENDDAQAVAQRGRLFVGQRDSAGRMILALPRAAAVGGTAPLRMILDAISDSPAAPTHSDKERSRRLADCFRVRASSPAMPTRVKAHTGGRRSARPPSGPGPPSR
jgi:hypothetical protein